MDDAVKRVYQEVMAISRKSVFDDEAVISFSDEHPLNVEVLFTPMSGHFHGAAVLFVIKLPNNYPNSRPKEVRCLTKVYHPNIALNGAVCLNVISGDWDARLRIVDFVQALLWLLQYPNLDSRLNGAVTHKMSEYAEKVKLAICGEKVGNNKYDRCLSEDASVEILLRVLHGGRCSGKTAVHKVNGADIMSLLGEKLGESLMKKFPALVRDAVANKMDVTIVDVGHGRWYATENCSKALEVDAAQVVKVLAWKVAGVPTLLAMCGHARVDVRKVAALFNVSEDKVELIKRKEVCEATGHAWTSVALQGGKVAEENIVLDVSLLAQEHLFTSGGAPHTMVGIKSEDLVKILGSARVASIAEGVQEKASEEAVVKETTNEERLLELARPVEPLQIGAVVVDAGSSTLEAHAASAPTTQTVSSPCSAEVLSATQMITTALRSMFT